MNSIYLISNSNTTIWKISNIWVKLCVLFFASHSSCLAAVWVESLRRATGMCVVSGSRRPFDISAASQLLGAESRQMSASLLSHKGKEAVKKKKKKKDASSIIYLITVSIRQGSRARRPRGFCEALRNRLACKRTFKSTHLKLQQTRRASCV